MPLTLTFVNYTYNHIINPYVMLLTLMFTLTFGDYTYNYITNPHVMPLTLTYNAMLV